MGIVTTTIEALRARRWHAMEWLAWILLAFWSVLWLLYSLATAIATISEMGPLALVAPFVVAVLICALLFLCWRWQVIGAGIVVLASLVCILYAGFDNWLEVVLLDVPPLVAGVLLATAWIKYNENLTTG